MIAAIKSLLDSAPFRAFFAAWTGVYLVQVIKGEEGAPVDELTWIIVAAAVGVFLF